MCCHLANAIEKHVQDIRLRLRSYGKIGQLYVSVTWKWHDRIILLSRAAELSVSMEFPRCCRILYWPVIREQISIFLSGLGGRKKYITTCTCIHDCTMKYMTATKTLTSRILKILNYTVYLAGFRGRRKCIAVRWKFTTVSHRIWQTGPHNFEKIAVDRIHTSG